MHFTRNALADAARSGRRVVAAFIATAFRSGPYQRRQGAVAPVADQVRPKPPPKLAALLDEAEEDVLAYMSFPNEYRAKVPLDG